MESVRRRLLALLCGANCKVLRQCACSALRAAHSQASESAHFASAKLRAKWIRNLRFAQNCPSKTVSGGQSSIVGAQSLGQRRAKGHAKQPIECHAAQQVHTVEAGRTHTLAGKPRETHAHHDDKQLSRRQSCGRRASLGGKLSRAQTHSGEPKWKWSTWLSRRLGAARQINSIKCTKWARGQSLSSARHSFRLLDTRLLAIFFP